MLRFAKGRGPFTTAEAEERFGARARERCCTSSSAPTCSCAASCGRAAASASGATPRCSAASAAPRSPRSAARSSRPSRPRFGRFLPAWHGIGRRASLREALVPLQGLALPVSLWESEVLPRRVPGYQPAWLDALCAAGRARLGRRRPRPRRRLLPRGRAAARRSRRARRRRRPPRPRAIREALGRSAMFWADLLAETGLEAEAALPALWELVWAGEVTNDAWTPLRAGRRYEAPRAPAARPRRFSRTRGASITSTQGRWSPTERLFAGDARPARARGAAARAAGHRHARRRARRGDPGRLRRRLLGAEGSRDDRRLPARLLRRRARRRPVRAARRGRAPARAPRRGGARAARARGRRSRAAVRRRAAVAAPRRRARRARGRRAGRAARRRGGALRRARRQDARAAARARRGLAAAGGRGARRATSGPAARSGSRSSASTAARSPRRRSCRCSSRPASSPARAAPCFARNSSKFRRRPARSPGRDADSRPARGPRPVRAPPPDARSGCSRRVPPRSASWRLGDARLRRRRRASSDASRHRCSPGALGRLPRSRYCSCLLRAAATPRQPADRASRGR